MIRSISYSQTFVGVDFHSNSYHTFNMGCDGGTIPKRDELVTLKKKPEQVRTMILFLPTPLHASRTVPLKLVSILWFCRKTRCPNYHSDGNIVMLVKSH